MVCSRRSQAGVVQLVAHEVDRREGAVTNQRPHDGIVQTGVRIRFAAFGNTRPRRFDRGDRKSVDSGEDAGEVKLAVPLPRCRLNVLEKIPFPVVVLRPRPARHLRPPQRTRSSTSSGASDGAAPVSILMRGATSARCRRATSGANSAGSLLHARTAATTFAASVEAVASLNGTPHCSISR
ncbi:MAG: hypothetical protein KatS3mg060_0192 [Dehalococcoidia bacterium]|nr:MAG: hypothetical protein KatS3mg060_0192 [Dehalococcoidia bacterium]